MLNRTVALCLLSVSLYGAYVGTGRAPFFEARTGQDIDIGQGYADLLAQEEPNNAPPHRGSGRCDQVC